MRPSLLLPTLLLSFSLPAHAVNPPDDPPPPQPCPNCKKTCAGDSSFDYGIKVGRVGFKKSYNLLNYSRVGAVKGSIGRSQPQTLDSILETYEKGGALQGQDFTLRLSSPYISGSLADPASLTYSVDALAEIIKDPSGTIRQIKTDTTLVDIEKAISGGEFKLRIWSLTSIPNPTKVGGFYGIPIQPITYQYLFKNPDYPLDQHRLDIVAVDNSGGSPKTTTERREESWSTTTNKPENYTISTYDGDGVAGALLRKELITYFNRGVKAWDYSLERQVWEATTSPSGQLGPLVKITQNLEEYKDFSIDALGGGNGTRRLVSEIIAYNTPAAVGTTWEYYEESENPFRYGRVKSVTKPDGSWEYYEYSDSPASAVSVETKYSSWKNVAMGDRVNARKRVTVAEKSKITRIESIGLQVIAREEISNEQTSSGEIITTTRRWDGSDWSVSAVGSYPQGGDPVTFGKTKWEEHADGTATTYAYAGSAAGLTVTVRTGAGSRNGIINGTQTETDLNSAYEEISEVRSDIVSGLGLGAWVGSDYDNSGRIQRKDYPDGTFEIKRYSCCGLEYEVDRKGKSTTYWRDALKRVYRQVEKLSSAGSEVSYTSEIAGNTTTVRKSAGGVTLHVDSKTVNLAGDVVNTTKADENGDGVPEGYQYSTEYISGGGRRFTEIRPDGSTNITTWFADGQFKELAGTARYKSVYDYGVHNENGGGTWTKAIEGVDTLYQVRYFDALGRNFKTEKSNGGVETKSFYGQDAEKGSIGRLQETVDADNVSVVYAYDAMGNESMIREGIPGNRKRDVRFSRDIINDSEIGVSNRVITTNNQVVVKIEIVSADSSAVNITEFGNVTRFRRSVYNDGSWSETTSSPTGERLVDTFQSGLKVRRENFDRSSNSVSYQTWGYDDFLRLVEESASRTGTVRVNNFTESGNVLSKTFPANSTSPTGGTTLFTYDVVGNQVSVDLPDSHDASGIVLANISYQSYYPTGKTKAIWGAGDVPSLLKYDGMGRLCELRTYSNLGVDEQPGDGLTGYGSTKWVYNTQSGMLAGKEDAAGRTTKYHYSLAGRILMREWARMVAAGTTLQTSYYYEVGHLTQVSYNDGLTLACHFYYDDLGRRNLVLQGANSWAYEYDAASQMLKNEIVSYDVNGDGIADFSRTIARKFDSNNQETGYQLMDAASPLEDVNYSYDNAGRVATVSAGSDSFEYQYDPSSESLVKEINGPLTKVINNWDAGRNMLLSRTNKIGSNIISEFQYQINAVGQRTALASTGQAFAIDSDLIWGYDSRGNLVKAGSSDPAKRRSYEYNSVGGRLKAADGTNLPVSNNFQPNILNQYESIDGFIASYDEDGNAVSYPAQTVSGIQNRMMEWDGENRLVAVKTSDGLSEVAKYSYDFQGRRISKTIGGVTKWFIYDDWNLIAEISNTGTVKKTYLWGQDIAGNGLHASGGVGALLMIRNVESGSKVCPLYDGNGNVSEYINEDGSVACHFEYDPFGKIIVDTDVNAAYDIRFSTKVHDFESGFIYYGYRYYSSYSGSWLSSDPIEEEGGLNLYAFIRNDAINHFDALGQAVSAIYCCPDCSKEEEAVAKAQKALEDLQKSLKECYDDLGDLADDVAAASRAYRFAVAAEVAAIKNLYKYNPNPYMNRPKSVNWSENARDAWLAALLAISVAENCRQELAAKKEKYEKKKEECLKLQDQVADAKKAVEQAKKALAECQIKVKLCLVASGGQR